MTPDQWVEELDRAVQVPGLSNIWVPPIRNRIDMLTTGIKSPIGVKVRGSDLAAIDRLRFLPPHSSESNPAEYPWQALRDDCFANHVFANLDAVERSPTVGVRVLEADASRLQSTTGFTWITAIRLNATGHD